MKMRKIVLPIIDNGMGLSRTSWAMCLAACCLGPLREYDVTLQSISYPYCSGALNIATNDFLLTDAEEMVIIDTDISFKPEQLGWLLEHDEPMVFGLYPKKEVGLKFPMEWLTSENPFAPNPFAKGVAPLVEVKRMARGFARIHRKVFETLAPFASEYVDAQSGHTHREFWKYLPGGHSEDFAFCDFWRSIGGKILVDQRITAQHEGSVVYPIKGTF